MRTSVPDVESAAAQFRGKVGFRALFSTGTSQAVIVIGLRSFIGLLTTYVLSTWLPRSTQDNSAEAGLAMLLLAVVWPLLLLVNLPRGVSTADRPG